MSPILPFDIVSVIIDIMAENRDTDLLKRLALVNHSFLQIYSKHLFATVELHDEPDPTRKKYTTLINGFVKLLKKQTRCRRVGHIRKLTYRIGLGARCLQTIFIIFRRSTACSHPSQISSEQFLKLNCLTIASIYLHEKGMEYTGLFPDISVASPHASSYH